MLLSSFYKSDFSEKGKHDKDPIALLKAPSVPPSQDSKDSKGKKRSKQSEFIYVEVNSFILRYRQPKSKEQEASTESQRVVEEQEASAEP
jgi:hypothetical protein